MTPKPEKSRKMPRSSIALLENENGVIDMDLATPSFTGTRLDFKIVGAKLYLRVALENLWMHNLKICAYVFKRSSSLIYVFVLCS